MEFRSQLLVTLCWATIFGTVLPLNTCRQDAFLDQNNYDDASSYRLPKEVVPTRYNLTILTELDNFTYEGTVSIRVNVLAETRTIILHSDGLIIDQNSVELMQRINESMGTTDLKLWRSCRILCQFHDPIRQFYVIVADKIVPGEYTVTIKFRGEIRDDVFGFYRSSYMEDGETRWMGVTQFSPTYARRAFPCMDEPGFKAVFELNIGARNRTVTSSTEDRNDVNGHMHKFVTPVMATYLVGWAIHDFVPESPTPSSKNFQMWTRGSMRRRGSIALNQSAPIFSFLNQWLRVGNPIQKIDQIAVPDFNFHAMENWGMITYRESVVLYEDGVTPTKYMVDGLTTMTHEYAHTWFGNLVTPTFWDVAWLKEGFASFFQYFAVSRVYPAWAMMDKFVVDVLQPTLLLDSANHNRTMNGRNVGSPKSAMGALDFVSYKKGSSVIRMMSHVIGESVFQNGLQMYLREKSYQAVRPHDLYEHLQNSVNTLSGGERGPLVEEFMETWTNQPGYPLVTVTKDLGTQLIRICQEPFARQKNKSSFEWWIPLSIATKSNRNFSNTSPSYWLKPGHRCLNLTVNLQATDWIVTNVQQTGYYRVNYDRSNWGLLTDYLKSGEFEGIHVSNRASLIDDAFNLARWGYIDYSIPFNLSSYLTHEYRYEPWTTATNNFKFLSRMLNALPDVQAAFHVYASNLLKGVYEQLSFVESKEDDVTTKLMRETILSTSCLVRNVDCLRKSKVLFDEWMQSPRNRIPKDVKSFVYCEGIRNADNKTWYTVLDSWRNTDLQTEQELLLQGLGCAESSDLTDVLLELAITDEKNVRKQQRMIIVNAVLDGNVQNVDYVLKYVESNLPKIIELRGHDFLGKIITAIGKTIITSRQTKMLSTIIESHLKDFEPVLDSVKQAHTVATESVKWIEEYAPRIADYFGKRIVQ